RHREAPRRPNRPGKALELLVSTSQPRARRTPALIYTLTAPRSLARPPLTARGRLYRIRPGTAVGGGVNANLGAPASPQDVAWGAVQAGVVANNYLGVATNYQTADMFGLAQAPATPPSSTTISGYADTSAQWNFGTGNANLGWLGRTSPNSTTTRDVTFSTDPETRRTVPIDYAKTADV